MLRNGSGGPAPVAASDRTPLRQRVARLSLLSLLLIVAAVGLLVLAVWIAVPSSDHIGHLPVARAVRLPDISLVVAGVAVAIAFFVVLAALNAAAAMRVLARDRRIPTPLTPE